LIAALYAVMLQSVIVDLGVAAGVMPRIEML
jgi:hypothetical protein